MNKNISKFNNSLKGGFTLTELLVVIFMMIVIIGISAISLTQNNTSQGLDTAASTLQSLINEARSKAISENTRTRLAINNEPNTGSDYRRQIIVASYNSNNTSPWEAASRAITLPIGMYIDPSLNITGLTGLGSTQNGSTAEFSKQSISDFYIEFDHLGICRHQTASTSTASPAPGAVLCLVKGDPNATLPSNASKVGVIIWRNGSTSTVTDPSRIN